MILADFTIQNAFKSNQLTHYARASDKQGTSCLLKYVEAGKQSKYAIAELKFEYKLIQSLDPFWVLPIKTLVEEQGQAAIVYQLMDGGLLSEFINEGGASFSEKLKLAIILTESVHYLHKNNLLHRNVCPESFWISADLNDLYISDLSLVSKLKRDESSRSTQLIGNVSYASPEQTGRSNLSVDNRSDLYSLGATLYELFSGQRIFSGSDQDPLSIMYSQLTEKVVPLSSVAPEIPEVISNIITCLLEKSPDKRYQSSFGLLSDLQRISDQWQASKVVDDFSIAGQDAPEDFYLSQKLYGRDPEINNLLEQFKRVVAGASELVLIGGYSGVGKSALVKELQKPITAQKSLFTLGKCDQFNREQPYTVFVQALKLLMRQLLSLNSVARQDWKQHFQQQLGDNVSVINEMIPELSTSYQQNIGTPQVLGSAESENRFQLTFSKFVHAFSRPENPLVIFLDDLQWADGPSLKLIEQLLDQQSSLMIIGAYRDNEVDQAHPLSAMTLRIAQAKKNLCRLTLKPLNQSDLQQLIADSLWLPVAKVAPLAQICMEKTHGNPFFVNQFLLMLNDEGLIYYSHEQGLWRWYIEQIEAMSVTSNVVDLMVNKLKKLPDETIEVVKYAANLGNKFSLKQLEVVTQLPIRQVNQRLWPMIAQGLILPLDESYRFEDDEIQLRGTNFAFLHDRVQQAAYQQIQPDALAEFKWQAGSRLLAVTSDEQLEPMLFAIVEQLNAGIDLAQGEEKQTLIALNIQVANKARRSSAYGLAQTLLLKAKYLADSASQAQCLTIYLTLAEVSDMIGDFELAESLYPKALDIAGTALEQVSVYAVQTAQYQIQGRFIEAIQLQKQGLAALKIVIANDEKQIAEQFMLGFERIDRLIEDHGIANLLNKSEMTQPEHDAAMQLLRGMWYASYLAGQT